jgi:hypothetical protein
MTQLDDFTRYEFGFSGLECRTLGTFYRDTQGNTRFGADVENFYSAHNYSVYKPVKKVLEKIVNFRDGRVLTGQRTDIRLGCVRYSSSRRFQEKEKDEVAVYVASADFLGTRTALFGMTRTGKSNTVKKIIQATAELSSSAPSSLSITQPVEQNLNAFTESGGPKFPVGQIIFDINGVCNMLGVSGPPLGYYYHSIFKDNIRYLANLQATLLITLIILLIQHIIQGSMTLVTFAYSAIASVVCVAFLLPALKIFKKLDRSRLTRIIIVFLIVMAILKFAEYYL